MGAQQSQEPNDDACDTQQQPNGRTTQATTSLDSDVSARVPARLYGKRWIANARATLDDHGDLHIYARPADTQPIKSMHITGCSATVTELSCDTGEYCVKLQTHCEPHDDAVQLCFGSSVLHTSWLEALQAAGAKFEEVVPAPNADSFFDFSAVDNSGDLVKFDAFRGDVCLVVNVASK